MSAREGFQAVLTYRPYKHLPVVRFGHWPQTLVRWHREGHITDEELLNYSDGNAYDQQIARKQGFDFSLCYHRTPTQNALFPAFEEKALETHPDGLCKKLDADGVIVLEKPGAYSIPTHVGHTLVDRKSFEEHYRFRLEYSDQRIDFTLLDRTIQNPDPECVENYYVGSLFGILRNWMGLEGLTYLMADDEALCDEIVDLIGNLVYRVTARVLEYGLRPDVCHFWEDICFRSGPLVNPNFFRKRVGPHYRKITDLIRGYGVEVIYLDCDGVIDTLAPIWVENGVNTMFPIEVGTWQGSIRPLREKCGKDLRGIGGLNKLTLEQDRAAIDAEIERMKPLVDLGGYLPCPDHHLTPDTSWENVQYYCDRMRSTFG